MITQDHPEFKRHLRFLAEQVVKNRGWTPYVIRTEVVDISDPKEKNISCGCCDKPVHYAKECKWKKTSIGVNYLDTIRHTICCGKTIDGQLCPIICIPCQRISLFLTPHKNKRGFEYKPGVEYHIDSCPECNGATKESLMLEQIVYDRINKLKP